MFCLYDLCVVLVFLVPVKASGGYQNLEIELKIIMSQPEWSRN